MGGLLRLADRSKRSQIHRDLSPPASPYLRAKRRATSARRVDFSPACFARSAFSCRSRFAGSLFPSDVRSSLFLDRRLSSICLRRFRRHHLIRALNQILQLLPIHGVQPIQHHPLVAPNIRRRTYILSFNQLSETLRRALNAKPRIIQPEHGKNLAADLAIDLETKLVAPLQLLRSAGECQAKFANRIYVHYTFDSESDRATGNPILQGDSTCRPALLAIPI
jgi:hypothetical protein